MLKKIFKIFPKDKIWNMYWLKRSAEEFLIFDRKTKKNIFDKNFHPKNY